MAAKSGRTPIRKVAIPIIVTVTIRHVRRPMRSPRCPNTIAPSGRAAKPTAKEANAASVATTGSFVVK